MAEQGASEDDITAETDNSIEVESKAEDTMYDIRRALAQNKLYHSYQTTYTAADSWLTSSSPEATDFGKDGRLLMQQLEALSIQMEPYREDTLFQPLQNKVKDGLGKIRTILFTSKSPAATTAPPAAPKKLPPPYQVKTPTFSGRVKDFQQFSDRFTEIMSIHSEHYSDADKFCILADAMTDREARKVVNDYASEGFDVAFQQLRDRYGRASTIYPQLVEELITRNRYDYSQESMLQALDRTQRVLSAMDKIGGKNIEALAVALVLRDCDEEVRKEWARHLGTEDKIPVLEDFVKFAAPLSHHLPRKSKAPNPGAAAFKPGNSGTKSKEESAATTAATSSRPACLICKGKVTHSLMRCSTFKESIVSQRWGHINRHKG